MSWIDMLSEEGKEKLNRLLIELKAKEEVYKNAEEPAIAQIWLAILELLFKMDEMEKRLRVLELRTRTQSMATSSLIEDLKNY